MKQKKTAWFLLPVVLMIWGVIGWKVYAAVKGENRGEQPVSVLPEKKAKQNNIPDTFHLIASYRDPFLGSDPAPVRKNISPVKKTLVPPVKIAEPVKINWPAIVYFGLVKKTGAERISAFLTVDGSSYVVQPNGVAGVVNVGKVWKDSVEVFWGKERKTIRK